jgi:hypothetical protein
LQHLHDDYATFGGCHAARGGLPLWAREGRKTLNGDDDMTLHDVALTTAAKKATTMKVSEWFEYYAPSNPVAKSSEQVSTSKLEVLDQMFAYYE